MLVTSESVVVPLDGIGWNGWRVVVISKKTLR